jgi:hypothetical protein
MNYLFYENETPTKAKVMLIYHVEPPQELKNNGNYITVAAMPEAEQQAGKTALPYCNPQTGEVWYEYVDRPLTPEEMVNAKIQEQQAQIEGLTSLLGEVLLKDVQGQEREAVLVKIEEKLGTEKRQKLEQELVTRQESELPKKG